MIPQERIRDILEQSFSRSGFLAADESPGTINDRLKKLGLGQHDHNAWLLRELLLTTPCLGKYWSGVILYDREFWSQALGGKTFPTMLTEAGLLPVIKVDAGMETVPGGTLIKGLEGLAERVQRYREAGAAAAKFRWAFGPHPPQHIVRANVRIMAAMAATCLEAGVLATIEPELDRKANGGTHTIQDAERTMRLVFGELMEALEEWQLPRYSIVIKTNMIEAGSNAPQPDVELVAERTIAVITEALEGIGGVKTLSGGQSTELALLRQNQIAKMLPAEWTPHVDTSWSRAALGPAFEAFGGDLRGVERMWEVLELTGEAILAARNGRYNVEMYRAIEAAVRRE